MLLAAICFLVVIALCGSVDSSASPDAEEPMLGMGRRHYLGEGRLDIKYGTALSTLHVDWADPYAGGPISAFVVPSVMEGRTLVELMQRLSMTVDAVTIDPAWDVNKWTMSFGEAYGARSERAADGTIDYSLVYRYLEEDLTSDRRWEVMVMHGILGWGHLPAAVKQAVLDRVREGMGLVLVGPHSGPRGGDLGELSPLLPIGEGPPDAVQPQGWVAPRGSWEAAESHYITAGVPVGSLPGDHLGHREYTPAPGATVLATAGGDPVLAVRQVGQGRVVAFGYENYGLAPFVRWEAYGEVGDAWWETWYSLMIRAILWAARREPTTRIAGLTLALDAVGVGTERPVGVAVGLTGSAEASHDLAWQVRTDAGEVVLQGSAGFPGGNAEFAIPVSDLDGGRYLADVFLLAGKTRVDWASAPFTITSAVRVADISAPEVIDAGVASQISAALTSSLPADVEAVVELVDNYQRVISRAAADTASSDARTVTASLAADDLLTHIGWVRVMLRRAGRTLDVKQKRVAFAAPPGSRAWDDYEVNIPFYGPHNYYHWMPLADEQYRRAGITWLMEPERNFRFTVLAQPGGLGVYYYDRKPFEEQMASYWETGDKRYLERQPCLHREWRDQARRIISAKIVPYLKYRPFHYYIADEPSLTSYTRAFDFCYSAETLAAFRDWLRRQYRSLRALNEVWGSSYQRWSEIEPPPTEEAQRHGRVAAWADFRRFMDAAFAEALHYTQQVVEELDPGALTLVGGTQMPTPFNGTDWWLLSRAFGILEPYSGIDRFRSFNPDLPIIQACGYQDEGPALEEEIWRRALQGQRGATIFWNYTLHDPDLVLNSQGEAMARAFGALRGQGIAKLLLGARRDHCRVAMLHSQMSLYAAWIQDGDIRSGRSQAARRWIETNTAWARALVELGLQYHVISYEQLARGRLRHRDFDLLVLPQTISLSDAEVAAIRTFAAAGGVVVADGEPGRFDEHCRRRAGSPLAGLEGLHTAPARSKDGDALSRELAAWLRPMLDRAGIGSPARIAGAAPEVIHYMDGKAHYVGIIGAPDGNHAVEFGRHAHVYDVRAGRYLGEAERLEVEGDERSVDLYALLPAQVRGVEVQAPVRLARGEEAAYHVKAEAAASFRHVFAVRVYAPDGSLRHMYGSNLDAPRGAAEGRFRLAWNDPVGRWRIVASDAATGMSGEASFTVS